MANGETIYRAGYKDRHDHALYCVCRVDVGGEPMGTGFLVGPDTVLTNYHVLRAVIGTGRTLADGVECRFDVDRQADGHVTDGRAVSVLELLAFSSNAASEDGDDEAGEPPTLDELDYALIRIAERVGEAVLPSNARPRGWIELPQNQPRIAQDERVYIVQHSQGEPASITHDGPGIIRFTNTLRNRVTYTPKALPGASGSPCYNDDWDIIALHNWGDPVKSKVRRGIPIGLVRQDILRQKQADAIPAMKAVGDVELLKARFEALQIAAARDGALKRRLQTSRETLDGVAIRLARQKAYKALHEFLHQIQAGTLPDLLAAAPVGGDANYDKIVALADNLLIKLPDALRSSANIAENGPYNRGDITLWLDELKANAADLVEAAATAPRKKILAIRRLLRNEMPQLNTALMNEAQSIDFAGLKSVLDDSGGFASAVAAGGEHEAPGAAVLRLRDELLRRVRSHRAWQGAENGQLGLEDLIGGRDVTDPATFGESWELEWQAVQKLCREDLSQEPLAKLLLRGEVVQKRIEEADWRSVGRDFGAFRRLAIQTFGDADRSLLDLCERIGDLGDPLAGLLRAIT